MTGDITRTSAGLRKILVAEDEAIVAQDLCGRLTAMNFDVVGVAKSADDAVQKALALHPDIALLDVVLRGSRDGIEAARQIRHALDVPVVFATASSDPETFARAQTIGPHGFVFKPYDTGELRITLELALSQHAAERRIRRSEERYRVLFESNLAGVFRLNESGAILDANPAFSSMLGLSAPDADGHPPATMYFADPHEYETVLHRLHTNRKLEAQELRLRRADGQLFWGVANMVVTEEGDIVGTLIDVTGRKEIERELAQQRQFLRALVDTLPDQVYVKDLDHRFIFCNPGCTQHFGISETEILGRTDVELSLPDFAANAIAAEIDVMSSGLPRFNREERQIDAAGTPRWVLASRVPVLDPDGCTSGIIGINRDITAQKQYEEMLQDDVRFQQTLLDAIPAPVFYCDAGGRFLGCNASFEAFFGHQRDTNMGLPLDAILPFDIAETFSLANAELIEKHGSMSFETILTDASGQPRAGLTHQAAFEDADGNVEGTVSVFIDLTEQQELRDALARSEQRYRNMFEDVNAVMLLLDPETGRITDANAAAARFYGYGVQTLTSMHIGQINPAPFEILLAGLQRAKNGSQKAFTWEHRLANGELRNVEVHTGPVTIDGKSAVFSIIHDITERVRAQDARRVSEEQREALESELRKRNIDLERTIVELRNMQTGLVQSEKMASIGQLTAGIAHEINNPLAFVMSNLNRFGEYFGDTTALLEGWKALALRLPRTEDTGRDLRQQEAEEKQLDLAFMKEDFHRLMEHTTQGAERIKRIVEQLRGFSHVAGAGFTESSINEAIEDTLMITWNELKYKATVHREYGDLPAVTCNVGEMKQVFVNLLVNAAHALDTQGEITVRTYVQNDRVHIQIQDTGCGIPRENLKRIFDPFFTTKPTGKGTGLGLWITATLVRKHLGEITVDSEIGRGTTFTIDLPVRQTEPRGQGHE